MREHYELPSDKLRARIDPDSIPVESALDIELTDGKVIGQARAIDAIRFGMGMKRKGYNIFIAGPAKAGLTYTAKTFIEEQAKNEPAPPDWCYVYNFKEKDAPKALQISTGRGKDLKKDMSEFIKILQDKIPEVFSSEDFAVKDREVHESFERKRQEIIEGLSLRAREQGFVLQFSQVGMMIVPAGPTGQPMTQEDIQQLDEHEISLLKSKSEDLHKQMKETMKMIQEAEGEFKERHAKLEKEIALFVVGQLMDGLEERYNDEPKVLEYLHLVQEDILEHIDDFKKKPQAAEQHPGSPQEQAQMQAQPGMQAPMPPQDAVFRKYEVNVLIDNSEVQGAPVVIESNPAYPHLFGAIEKQAWFGALFTDHTMIKPGAMHKANGGYLILKALDLLRMSVSYESMQRTLRDGEIKIEDVGELYGLFSTKSLRPEPIPLNLKIVLTGDPQIYQLLYSHDDRFQKHFKVKAHMDTDMDREDGAIVNYARALGRYCKEHELLDVDRSGIARVIEYAMEKTDTQEKLTLEFEDIGDLLTEADYFAREEGSGFIQGSHVAQAAQKRKYRAGLYEDRLKEVIKKDIFWVETDGFKVGQVNGLSVLMTGDHMFGQPNRITANVSVGKEGAISVDRESKMSGNIHTKGLLTLSSFLKERFAHNKPISLSASLSFEQSYGMVDGDSASSTELYVLLSALSGAPIYQGIAVTGSVSQKGEVQPIGGVNHKIKGFFDICKHKGLTGKQGVMIPSKNIRNLMLDQEVVDAVKEGKFHIWPVTTIEEGIEILTGVEAGSLQPDGTYPEGTIFRKADDRLVEIGEIVRKFGKDSEEPRKAPEENSGGCPHCGG